MKNCGKQLKFRISKKFEIMNATISKNGTSENNAEDSKDIVTAHLSGPLMAEILTKCLQIKDYQGEEVNVILGTFSQKQVDAKIKDDVDPFTEAKIKKKDYFPMLILPLPKTVYCYPDEDNSTSYNHKNFNKWMAQLRPHLKLADEIDIIGFIRFTHMDIPTTQPFGLKDLKLCRAIGELENMSLLLMVANVQNKDDRLGFSDTATDVLALDIVSNENPWYKKCHVKVLNIGDTSNQSSNSANSLFKDVGRVNGFWNTIESHSKEIEKKMQGMFEEYQNWQVKLIDNKIVLEEEPPSVKTENREETENYVKTEFVVNGTQVMEVQENKENQASPAKKVKREL